MPIYETVPPTAAPLAAAAAIVTSPTPAPTMQQLMAELPPAWYMVAVCALGCVPLVLLVAYWLGKVKCEKLVTWALVAWLVRCVVEVVYAYDAGKKAVAQEMAQQTGVPAMM